MKDATIEAEVVEIDGVAVQRRDVPRQNPLDAWAVWLGRLKRLDARWWPLWVVLGLFALVIAVSVGMCAAVLFVAWRMIAGLAYGTAKLLFPSQELHRR